MADLDACPHCGQAGFARVKRWPWEKEGEPGLVWGYHVICDASGIDTHPRGCGASSGWGETPEEAIAAWNRRATPQPAQVAVKPLEWGERRTNSDGNWAWDAKTSIGWYIASTASGEGCKGSHFWFIVGETISAWADSEAEAKAAAQADYETRIRSALAPSPADGAVEALADCIALLDALAESALKDDDTATWAMCSVMADKHRPALATLKGDMP